ncbi:MAG: SulP family inorganic anion transporter [Acidobacteriota bacterium]
MMREMRPNNWVPDLFLGLSSGALTVTQSITMAALIFSGELSAHLPAGIGMALIGACLVGAIVALKASFPLTIAGPQSVSSVIIALSVSAIAASLSSVGSSEQIFPTIFVFVVLTSLLVGLFLFILGRFHLGTLIRFIPYPVVGGFLAGTGWLLCAGSIRVMTGEALRLEKLPQLFQSDWVVLWLPGLIFAFVLLVTLRLSKGVWVLPSLLLGAVVLFYLTLWIGNISLDQASSRGMLLGPFPGRGLWQPVSLSALTQVNWPLLLGQTMSVMTIMFVVAISLLLNATGLELATQSDIDLDRELRAAGIGNIAASLGGGLVGYQFLGFSVLNSKAGAGSRLVGLLSAALCAAALVLGAPAVSYFPKPVVGGMLLFLGLSFLVEWLYDGWAKLQRPDYLLVVTILFFIATVGYLEGVGIGVLIAMVFFAVNYSRVDVMKHVLSGETHRSNVERPGSQQELLQKKGGQILILRLHGFLFFGSANTLFEKVRQRIDAGGPGQEPVRYVVLDFQLVKGLDSSAVLSFLKMKQLAQAKHMVLLFTNTSANVHRQLVRAGFFEAVDSVSSSFPDLDRGVEWCENKILESQDVATAGPLSFSMLLSEIFPGQEDHARRFVSYLEELEVPAGHFLFRQGESAGDLYFIASGQLSALLESTGGEPIRLRTMGSGTLVGEMGLYTAAARSASVKAEQPSTLYRLSSEKLNEMQEHDPEVASAFHRFVARLLASRLGQKSKEVQVLLE